MKDFRRRFISTTLEEYLNENIEFLLDKDVNFLRAAYPNPADQAMPKYYSLFGPEVINHTPTNELSFIVAPTPDAS